MEFLQILVPVGGTEADEEVIKLACRLAKPDKGKINAIYVITVKRTLPLDVEIEPEIQKSEGILSNTECMANEDGCRIETEVLQARDVGPAIVDEAVDKNADLIVMSTAHQWPLGEFNLGEVVPYVLKNAPCRVILYHQST
ncbi:MAG: universal stress protein [Chloroflexota bacterium]